jgi:DNA-nicking Smr family endonuclease
LGLGGVAATKAGGSETKTAATTTKKSATDVSIPYDAAARLAYDEYRAANEGKEIDFDTFQTKYTQMTVADVTAKKLEREMFPPTTKVDLSIPYDAAAKLAYKEYLAANNKSEWGNEEEYEQFKQKYEEMSVAQVTYKKLQKEMTA